MRSGNPRPDSPAGRANLHGWANVLTLGVAAAFGTAGHAMAQPTFGELGATGWGAGLGLLAASVPLGSMALAPPPNRSRPSPRGAAVLGLAIALGALPGCGPMTISVPVSAWLRARPREGVALVALAAVPIHALTVARHGSQLADLGSWEAIVGASVLGVGSAIGGLWALGKLADRGAIAWFAGITGPLGLALLATMWLGAA